MDPEFIGKKVSMDCRSLGFYQGTIVSINMDQQTITIKDAFQNGRACERPRLTISVADIDDLQFLDSGNDQNATKSSQVTNKKSSTVQVPKKKSSKVAEKLAKKQTQTAGFSPALAQNFGGNNFNHRQSPTKKSFGSFENHRGNTPKRQIMRDEDCFGHLNEDDFAQEFDFEENLALFDKKMVFEEIEDEMSQQNQPDVVRLVDCNRRKNREQETSVEPKYRNGGNVLMTMPAQYRPIETGEEVPPGEYVTDSGLIVPAISLGLRNKLEKEMEKKGLGMERLTELVARAGVEVVMPLFGGAHRLNPGNSHQVPLAVILCGLCRAGAIGLATARHLATQGVKTIVYLPDLPQYPSNITQELSLYKLAGQKWTFSAKALPNTPVDLIICALEDHGVWDQERRQPWLRNARHWAKNVSSRAPVLSIDPPNGPRGPLLNSKIILAPGLPLWHGTDGHNSKIVMANLATPKKIFAAVGIKFESPFGSKTVIPLHKVT